MKALLVTPLFLIFLFSCQPDKNAAENNDTQIIEQKSAKTLTASEFRKLSESPNSIILDVRTPEEVAEGKIPNAIVIDYKNSDFETKVTQLSKEKSIFIYCSAGVRSAKAAEYLISQGYPSVYHLEGGLGTWSQSNFPLEK